MAITDEILNTVEKVPSLPTSVGKILEITKNPDVSPNDLNRVIILDPILTGKVLRLVNSAYYSLGTKVNSIVKAIILLGVNTIRNLALTSAVLPLVGKEVEKAWGLNVQGYWVHSISTGVVAKLIGKHLGESKETLEEFFICGLLHDIGKVVLEHSQKEQYVTVIEKSAKESIELYEAETQLLGINHFEAGKLLAEKWDLSLSVVQSIEFHHNPKACDEPKKKLVYSIAVANTYTNHFKIGFSGNSGAKPVDEELLSFLNLTDDLLESWKEIILQEIKKASVFMKIVE